MLQHFARVIPETPAVRTLPGPAQEQRVAAIQGAQQIGGLAGGLAMAFSTVRGLGRRCLRLFQVPGLALELFAVLCGSSLTS